MSGCPAEGGATAAPAALRKLLQEGQRQSGQGSGQRRSPAKDAVPYLLEARSGLRRYVEAAPDDAAGWRALGQAEECLLNYAAARECLERAISLSGSDRRDLKRLVALRETEREWLDLSLTPEQLSELGDYLDAELERAGCGHNLRATRSWLAEMGMKDSGRVLNALRNRGGYCDCEVLANVVGD